MPLRKPCFLGLLQCTQEDIHKLRCLACLGRGDAPPWGQGVPHAQTTAIGTEGRQGMLCEICLGEESCVTIIHQDVMKSCMVPASYMIWVMPSCAFRKFPCNRVWNLGVLGNSISSCWPQKNNFNLLRFSTFFGLSRTLPVPWLCLAWNCRIDGSNVGWSPNFFRLPWSLVEPTPAVPTANHFFKTACFPTDSCVYKFHHAIQKVLTLTAQDPGRNPPNNVGDTSEYTCLRTVLQKWERKNQVKMRWDKPQCCPQGINLWNISGISYEYTV